ncbi:MAG: ATP-binding protein [Sulfolobales archaeon]|nr:ATP-binding protein [Sulfolobales archaeon]MDW8082966.1 ATP-binding protein [Sulfolobales archaeon]
MSSRVIGVVGEQSTPTEVEVKAAYPVPSGTYVYIKFRARDPVKDIEETREVVGIVGSTIYRSIVSVFATPSLSRINRSLVDQFENYSSDLKRESYMIAIIVADITGNSVEFPKYPPPPETPVYLANPEHLRRVYRWGSDSGIKVGSLVSFSELEVFVNVNALPKHLLVAGTTGSGKSNLIAVIADRIAQIGGSVVIFDVHGEYVGLKSESREVKVVEYEAAINPNEVPISQLVDIVIQEPAARRQRRILRNALKNLVSDIREQVYRRKLPVLEAVRNLYESKVGRSTASHLDLTVMYKELLMKYVEEIKQLRNHGKTSSRSSDIEKIIDGILEKIDSFFEWHIVDLQIPRVSNIVDYNKIVVVNVSRLSDEDRDYVLRIIADDLLSSLKMRSIPPTLLVVEEAHIFLNRKFKTMSKRALQRFIREGRKFGGMLAIVSQRPRALDTDVASQVQNFAFLRLVQEADRSAVMELTDVLGDEYSNIFPTLPPGHGIFVGEWVSWYPVYVKIDLHGGKRVGATPNVIEVWRGMEKAESRTEEVESLEKEWEGG